MRKSYSPYHLQGFYVNDTSLLFIWLYLSDYQLLLVYQERKSPRVIATGGYTGEVWYQEGPRRNGGKQVRAVPGKSLFLL